MADVLDGAVVKIASVKKGEEGINDINSLSVLVGLRICLFLDTGRRVDAFRRR